MKYNKLVRDKIPELVVEMGDECCFKKVEGSVLLDYIEKKIQEELIEFKNSPSIEEAVDIITILDKYFIETINTTIYDPKIVEQVIIKNESRGFFDNNFVLLETNEID